MQLQRRAGFFKVDQDTFALDGQVLRQVVTVPRLTPVPRSGRQLLGLFATRGQIVPLFDVRSLLGFSPKATRDLALLIEYQDARFAIGIDDMLGFFPYQVQDEAYAKGNLHRLAEAEIVYQHYTASLLSIASLTRELEGAVAF